MSLLIDALKQAEAQRKQAQASAIPAAAETPPIALEPLTPATTPETSASTVTPPPRVPASPPRSGVAASGRAMFEVKQAPQLSPLTIIVGIAALLFVIGALYVWYAIQPRSSILPPQGISQTEAPRPLLERIESPAQVIERIEPAPALLPAPQPLKLAPLPATMAATLPQAPAAPPTTIAPVFERQPVSAGPSLDEQGFAAWRAGNLELARQRYAESLRQSPDNLDALNALGSLSLHAGQPDQAERYFRRALQVHPKNATALAQLAVMYGEGDPVLAESRLRGLIAEQPDAAAAHFHLGGVYARQARWREAQQALFQAHTLDAANPDTLYNLAISLEHLQQNALALQFYEQAKRAASVRPAGFDPSQLDARIVALRPTR